MKKTTKKITSILLILTMILSCFAFVGCGFTRELKNEIIEDYLKWSGLWGDKEAKDISYQYLGKYGESVAKYMNLVDRRVDNERIKFPVRSTMIRNDLEENKKWIENNVYNDCKNIKF